MRNFIANAYSRVLVRSQWNIGIVNHPINSFLDPKLRPRIHWLPALTDGRFVADPFGVRKNGRLYVFCEDFDYGSHKGRISVIEVEGGNASEPQEAINLPVHMSYPYILEYGSKILCIPETYEAGEVALYESKDFPRSWSKVATLITGFRALDSTVFYHDGFWWLMCTNQDVGPHDTLFLWYAREVLGPWVPHPGNPVKKDQSSTRPAGTPFQHNGRLYRPAQDCSRYYGERIAINRVDRLTPSEFHEETVAWVGPFLDSPYPHGIHTISKVGDMTLVDAKRHKFIKKAFISAMVRNLRRIACGCS